VCTRSVLFSVKNESKDATQIADELKISLSTVYKTLSTLEELALAEVDKYVISSEGKKIKIYRSRIGKVEITLDDLEPSLNLYSNTANPKSNS
jgi:predicted transcriptional regulator